MSWSGFACAAGEGRVWEEGLQQAQHFRALTKQSRLSQVLDPRSHACWIPGPMHVGSRYLLTIPALHPLAHPRSPPPPHRVCLEAGLTPPLAPSPHLPQGQELAGTILAQMKRKQEVAARKTAAAARSRSRKGEEEEEGLGGAGLGGRKGGREEEEEADEDDGSQARQAAVKKRKKPLFI